MELDLATAERLIGIGWRPTYDEIENQVPIAVFEFWKELKAGNVVRQDKPVQASGVIGGVPVGLPPELRDAVEENA